MGFTIENLSHARILGANAPAGLAFRGRTGPLGYARMKSNNTGESPTGYRPRGPSAERQARKLARQRSKLDGKARQVFDALHAYLTAKPPRRRRRI